MPFLDSTTAGLAAVPSGLRATAVHVPAGSATQPLTGSIRTGAVPQLVPTVERSAENFIPVFSHRPQAVTRILLLSASFFWSIAVTIITAKPGAASAALPLETDSNRRVSPVRTNPLRPAAK